MCYEQGIDTRSNRKNGVIRSICTEYGQGDSRREDTPGTVLLLHTQPPTSRSAVLHADLYVSIETGLV